MTFWRRRKSTRAPDGAVPGRPGEGRLREVPEPDPPEAEGALAGGSGPDARGPGPDAADLWEGEDFTQLGGSDGGESEPDAAQAASERRAARFWGRRGTGAPEADTSEPHVVSTLLSQKPGKDAARAVAWTLGVLLFVSALYWWGPPGFAAALPASGETVFEQGETWRLVTALAAHADPIHLLSNAVFLTWLIYLSYGAFGPSLYPWTAVPLSAVALAVTLEGYPPNIRVVGASGMLYLLAGAWLMLYVLVERRLSVLKRIVRVVGFFLVVLVPTSIRPEVSYRAHGIGLFFGICLGLAYFLARRDTIRQGERWEWEEG